MSKDILPVILSGGSGTRLWPLSRESYPKQYLNLNSIRKKTLLQETLNRLKKLNHLSNPIIICNEEHRFIVAEQIREINIKPESIILEPFGKNTAPAIAMAALKSISDGKDPNLLVLPADHEIQNIDRFLEIIEASLVYSQEGRLVTFGIIPTAPEIGYGYIEAENELDYQSMVGVDIAGFIEKPNLETAKKLISSKKYTWNSGMFLFKASKILSELEKFAPEIVDYCRDSINDNTKDFDFERLNKEAFLKCPSISIDIAVMEKTSLGTVMPLEVGWSDLGSWRAVYDCSEKDKNGNVTKGKVILKESKDCYFRSENRILAGIGLENLMVIETHDAILITNKNKTQTVKNIVQELIENNLNEGRTHRKVFRPWGNYFSVVEGSSWQVKRIEVKPGASLSLQKHHHRSEHWIIVKGTAQVQINNDIKLLSENQSTYIPLGSKHRLSNPGKVKLVLIEVQSGTYLGEDDIVRYEDQYGR